MILYGQSKARILISDKEKTPISSGLKIEFLLQLSDKRRIFQRKTIESKDIASPTTIDFPIDNLKPGDYDLVSSIYSREGKILRQEKYHFKMPQRPWWFRSKIGMTDDVIPPWTPLNIEKKSMGRSSLAIECLQRVYEFGPLPMINHIEAAQKEILAEPIRFMARISGKDALWENASTQLKKQTPSSVHLLQMAYGKGMHVNVDLNMEYDGAIKVELNLNPSECVQLEQFLLRIPLKTEYARYLYFFPSTWPGNIKNASTVPSHDVTGPFLPYFWIGDDERGLAWFAESDEGWIHEDPNKAIVFTRENGQVVINIYFIRKSVKIGPKEKLQKLSYSFGLQATPVKPITTTVWDYRISHITQNAFGNVRLKVPDIALDQLAQAGVKTIVFHEHWTDIESYYETSHGDDLRNLIKRCHERGMQFLLYFGFLISDMAVEWPYLGNECTVGLVPQGYTPWNYPPQPIQNAYRVCYKSVWQDCLAAGIDKVMEEYDCDGVYLDGCQYVWDCNNLKHGCGYYRPDGTISTTYPIWAVRQLMKRIYKIVKSHKPNGQVNVHSSSCNVIPTLGWATSYWDGEQFNYIKNAVPVTEVISLEMFRTEFMGKSLGIPAEFLLTGAFHFKEALAITLLHDVPIRPVGINENLGLMSSLWQLRDRFETTKADWLPYFQNADYVKIEPGGCFASLYRHPQNGILVFLSNLSNQEMAVKARFDFERLGISGIIRAVDGLSGYPIAMNDDILQIVLLKLGWKAVWLKK